jgi:hypothetical protein
VITFASLAARDNCTRVVGAFYFVLEAGLFESKIRIRYACVHLGGVTKEISSSH